MLLATQPLNAAEISAAIKATAAAATTAATSSGENSGAYILGVQKVQERLQELLLKNPGATKPLAQKITVTCPKTLVQRAEVYFESVYGIIDAYPGIDSILGCTITNHREFTVYINGKKRLVVAHAEFYVLPRQDFESREIPFELANTIRSMAKEKFGYEPEQESEETLLVLTLQELVREFERISKQKVKKAATLIPERYAPVQAELGALLENTLSEIQHLKNLPADLAKREQSLREKEYQVEQREKEVSRKEYDLAEVIRKEGHKYYCEYIHAFNESIKNDFPEVYKALHAYEDRERTEDD